MTVALQQQQPSLVRTSSTSTARGQPRLVRKRENPKHSLLGRLRLNYARRGCTSASSSSSSASSTLKEAVAVPPPESSGISEECVENLRAQKTSSSSNTTTAARPTAILPKKRLVKRFRSIENNSSVQSGSLAGAKRSFVPLAPPSEEDGGYYDYSSDDEDEDSMDLSTSSEESSSSVDEQQQRRSRRVVKFAPRCLVTEIPHYSHYSPKQKKQQWNNRKAIKSRARINTFEYQHDGWKLETAAEEDSFIEFEGQLYHPAHKYTHQYIMMSSSSSAAEEQRE